MNLTCLERKYNSYMFSIHPYVFYVNTNPSNRIHSKYIFLLGINLPNTNYYKTRSHSVAMVQEENIINSLTYWSATVYETNTIKYCSNSNNGNFCVSPKKINIRLPIYLPFTFLKIQRRLSRRVVLYFLDLLVTSGLKINSNFNLHLNGI